MDLPLLRRVGACRRMTSSLDLVGIAPCHVDEGQKLLVLLPVGVQLCAREQLAPASPPTCVSSRPSRQQEVRPTDTSYSEASCLAAATCVLDRSSSTSLCCSSSLWPRDAFCYLRIRCYLLAHCFAGSVELLFFPIGSVVLRSADSACPGRVILLDTMMSWLSWRSDYQPCSWLSW